MFKAMYHVCLPSYIVHILQCSVRMYPSKTFSTVLVYFPRGLYVVSSSVVYPYDTYPFFSQFTLLYMAFSFGQLLHNHLCCKYTMISCFSHRHRCMHHSSAVVFFGGGWEGGRGGLYMVLVAHCIAYY